ncbi:MAG TPA: aminodeoxychorismate synthase, component I [bacterium]|nr:aminodeoxychorismate synthase, component I [bacterium]
MEKKDKALSGFLKGKNNGVFLHTSLQSAADRRSLLFIDAVKTIRCESQKHVLSSLKCVERMIRRGYYAAGYIAYEAGLVLNGVNAKNNKWPRPLLMFGIYKKPFVFEAREADAVLREFCGGQGIGSMKPSVAPAEYKKNFTKIRALLKEGEAYQINLCFKMFFSLYPRAAELFLYGLKNQKTCYAAFIRDKNKTILSFSPELFFRVDAGKIRMKPMKGTLLKPASKASLAKFKKDSKTAAENIMIVDLVRNDLGKICVHSSVAAPRLFSVEEYDTLYQMTSTVAGRLKKEAGFADVIRALFPSGSVTGAPKRRAMEIIGEIEKDRRGIYTGAIGYAAPRMKKAVFNIPIRTAVIDTYAGSGEFGTGSGIVYDSNPEAEHKECLGKAEFIRGRYESFKIFESILHENGGFFLLGSHLKRLEKAARFFGFMFDKSAVVKRLNREVVKAGGGKRKIRVFVGANGRIETDNAPVKPPAGPLKACVWRENTCSRDVFLRHKTTKREMYDRALKSAKEKGYDEVVFINERGEVTEAHSSNLFVLKNGKYYTPPVSCGLLPGTYREDFLAKMKGKAGEKILKIKDLREAGRVYLCNSVRGMREAEIVF